MPESGGREQRSYPNWIGFIYIFNLIVGTGALTLPGVFSKAGWLLSLIVIIFLAVISYITATFIIETMSCANAVRSWQNLLLLRYSNDGSNENDDDHDSDNNDSTPILPREIRSQVPETLIASNVINSERLESIPLSTQRTNAYYKLDEKFELGEMAVLFFNDFGRALFYICITIYLYGDLSIYSAAIAKSLRDIACANRNYTIHNLAVYGNTQVNDSAICWENYAITRLDVYRLFLLGFTLLFGPLAAFSVQKTKYLQLLTVVFRWLAFIFMISIAIKILCTDGAQGHPPTANFYGLPALYGACIYSFMCHHSLPSLLTPIRDKLRVHSLISYDYLVICLFYILLAMTGIYAFEHIRDLYTLNFIPVPSADHSFKTELLVVIDYFLALFPVFTLSTTYPIIAITLRNNLQTLFLDVTRLETYNLFVRRMLFPCCAIIPPLFITFFTESVTTLVAFTGSYAGVGIQYIMPISLVYCARHTCTELLGNGVVNAYASKFRSSFWLGLVLIWSLTSVCLVTINFFH